MQIIVNGEARSVSDDCSIQALLTDVDMRNRRVAVEVNQEVVPRSRHAEFRLAAGDRVEIIQAVGGG